MTADQFISFPQGFTWGVATSSYQIEGAWNEDGRGLSIWDIFSRMPGKTYQGDTGEIAADHYHRWQEDVQIMAEIGCKAYRFSISWPRVLPQGSGQLNSRGIGFYDRLVDLLLSKGIQPYATLYHWDLPQNLQDHGGWANRDTAYLFADYASLMAGKLGDRVDNWITQNEPFVTAALGHFTGEFAPGIQDPFISFKVNHHLLLSHGLAVEALRATAKRPLQIGITLDLNPVVPASDTEEDRQAAQRFDKISHGMYLEPLFRGQYPPEAVNMLGPLLPEIIPGDMELISIPIDFLGINYYNRFVIRYDPDFPLIQANEVHLPGNEYSQMWEIYPPGIYDLITQVWDNYHPPSIYVTENGIPVADAPDLDGRVRDYRRIRYLRDHMIQVQRAISNGVPLKGYFVWSLMDNFEWAFGYRMRFGLVYIDFTNLSRTIKESGHWYAQVIRENGLDPLAKEPYFPS